MPRLVVFRGDAIESEVRLTDDPVRIGRHAGNDVVLDDSLNGVSRSHAEIRRESGSYVIVDLKSRNGIWINSKRVKEKARLALGVPVNIGAFELVLEDDASATFESLVAGPQTVASAATTGGSVAVTRSTGSGQPPPLPVGPEQASLPRTSRTRQILLWSGAVVLVYAVTYTVVRNRSRPPIEAVAVEPVPAPAPAPTSTAPVEAPVPPAVSNKALNEQDLTAAREQMAAKNYAAALSEHLQPLLERDPENVEGRDLKRQADEAIAALEAAARGLKKTKDQQSAEVETTGIPRKPGEAYTDYTARVRQIQSALAEGKSALEKQEYVTALARLRAVERDAPKYQAADALAAEATAKQKNAVDLAIDNGQQNEQQSKLLEARRWYEIALKHDPASLLAREKRTAIITLMNDAAEKLYAQATAAVKMGATAQAKRLFQQVYDTTMPGDEYREKAAKQLELMSR